MPARIQCGTEDFQTLTHRQRLCRKGRVLKVGVFAGDSMSHVRLFPLLLLLLLLLLSLLLRKPDGEGREAEQKE